MQCTPPCDLGCSFLPTLRYGSTTYIATLVQDTILALQGEMWSLHSGSGHQRATRVEAADATCWGVPAVMCAAVLLEKQPPVGAAANIEGGVPEA
jgi:hypothetical protein